MICQLQILAVSATINYISRWCQACYPLESSCQSTRTVLSSVIVTSRIIWYVCFILAGTLHKSQLTGELTAIPGIYQQSSLSESPPTCHLSDLLPPVFLASHSTLARGQLWDQSLSSGLHADFLLTVKKRRLTAAVCKDIEVCLSICYPTV